MKLHLDSDAFRVLIEQVSENTGYRQDVIEKDYYVSMLLQELAQFQREGLPAYFKGGTALYKALHSVRRFSEDVDLSGSAAARRETSAWSGRPKNTPVWSAIPTRAAPTARR